MNVKKLLLTNLPYLLFVYPFDKVSQAFRLAPGADLSAKLLSIGNGFRLAFASFGLSFNPTDLLIGITGAVILRVAVHMKGKNAKKYRHGMEYGSARWGTTADIAPYMDKDFFQNIPMTQTERITMASRPKQPKYARNKNILVIGGSGSGKTRFFCKPSLLQAHSSYVCTDPKGTLLPEIGSFLERKKYRIKCLNLINFKKSMRYNPLAYIWSEKDILKLVNALIMVSDKDVSDHHAIIPTMEIEKADIKALPVGERNLFLLVCCKLLCASASPYEYEIVTADFDCGGHTFTAKGKRILAEGWREIERIFRSSLKEKPEDTESGGVLPDFTEGQTFENVAASVTEHFTSPPKPYTEDTLLSAMENAGKEDIPEDAERKGLGTPATRAAVIEKLVAAGFVERRGRNLIPTKAGINLVTVLPEALTSPMLTAEWEQRLSAVAKGEADPGEFMEGIRAMTRELIQTYSHISEDGQKLFAPEKEVIGNCPRCGKPVYEGKKNFFCSDRACGFVLWKDDRFWTSRKKELTKKMAADLLKRGRTNVKGMWSEKKGATYDAAVILDDTGGKYINFKLEFPKRKAGANGRK